MAATNYTPISLYYSTTASATPLAANLVAGELALNTFDEKLYFKNSSGVVKLLANSANTGTVTSVAASVPDFLSVSGSPITTSGTLAISYSGTALPVANGGTGITTTPTNGQIPIGNGTNYTAATLTAGSGVSITNSSGGITIAATGSGGTVTSVAATVPAFLSISGSPITSSGTLAISYSGTALPVANGGTGAISLTANNVILGNGTSAVQVVAPGANGNVLTSNGTTWTSAAPTGTAGGSNTQVQFNNSGSFGGSAGFTWDGTTVSATQITGRLKAYKEATTTVGTVATATYNIDLSLTNIFDITLGTNVTFTFTNPPSSGISQSVTVILRQDATGSRTATFTNAKYSDGVVPVLSTGANQVDVMTFFTVNGGTFWFGTLAMANVS